MPTRNIFVAVPPVAAMVILLCGCPGPAPTDVDGDIVETRRDHTVPAFQTTAAFIEYAGDQQNPAQVKFVISDFQDGASVHFEETGFYAMHDEWSWYSLLNGIAIPGYDFEPLDGMSFDTVADIFNWAKEQDVLPLDLGFVSDGLRLYSPKFYDRAFNRTSDEGAPIPRFFGCGSVLHFPADDRRPIPGETWAFELEYTDVPSTADVARFFELLEAALPDDAGDILWLVRSESQKTVAQRIDKDGGPLAGRWTTWSSLQVPGDFQTYNPGIAAGILKIVPAGEMPVVDSALTVAVLREIPDDIPPVAAIVTAVPQTPLSHIGILATARGTPNLYVAGVADDPRFETWDSYRKPIIVKATAQGYEFKEMSGVQWTYYKALINPRTASIQPVDVSGMAETFDPLTALPSQMTDLIPAIGGKTAGFIMLNAYPALDLPDQPIGLTVRGYNEFIATLNPPLADVLGQSSMADSRVRLAVTEGPDAYLAANGNSTAAQEWLENLRIVHQGDPIGKAIEAGGIREMVMTAPMDAGYLARVTAALADRFAFLSPAQGLRFRSSSSAEDVEGFNGAGLYESHTGYLHPELQPPKRQDKTVQDALRRVWASYWLFGAFQERELAGIDHLAANMGVLVHPVFDDDREAANGVLTLELVKRPGGDVITLTVNMQEGALSVTNPPPGSTALPEVDVVTREGDGQPTIERRQASTEVGAGVLLLSDAELLELLDGFQLIASDWLDLRNDGLKDEQKRSTLTVDSEIKKMSAGWPTLAEGVVNPERLVIKQARTVERPVLAPERFLTMPVPRDLLAYTTKIEKQTCVAGSLRVETYDFFTDPSQPWPFDYSAPPFVAFASFRVDAAIPGFPFTAGSWFMLTWLQAEFSHAGQAPEGPWKIRITPEDAATAGFDELLLDASGAWSISGPEGASASGTDATCTMTTELTSPQAFLESLMSGG